MNDSAPDGATDGARASAQRCVATLLVRNDAGSALRAGSTGFFRVHFGDGAAEVAASLGNGHCFEVLPVFALPQAPGSLAGSLADIVAQFRGASLGNGWFSGVALDALAASLVRLCIAGGSNSAAVDDPARDTAAIPTEHESEGEDAQEEEFEEEEEVWQHVEGCAAAEADKALDIRAALEQRLGKPEARKLLACTRATVAKQNGHKNRILRIGGTALKLRRWTARSGGGSLARN